MTQKSVNIPATFRNKDFWLRAVSVMLSLTLMVLCVPSYNSSTASGENQGGNPNVLTNSSVTFRDSKFKNVDSVESGEIFYLMATIAGNNVNQNTTDAYRIEITDNNLALLNFKDNGFTDGATYNGYTLHLERNDKGEITRRYIDFNITNGDTKVVRLQARFLNGKTANGKRNDVVKIIQTSTNKNITGSIGVKSSANWRSSKTEDKSQIKMADITNGAVINYTLNASPVNPNAKKGAWWINGLKFTDTLTLPDGLKFKDDARKAIEDMLPSQYQKDVTISGNIATITITVDSQNENAEMSSTTINIPFRLQDVVEVDPDKNFAGGTIDNELAVNGNRYGEKDDRNDKLYKESIGGNAVSLDVTAPKPADFNLSKTVEPRTDGKDYDYYLEGEEVTFKISATNVGEQAGDITLTDVVPTGMTLKSITGGAVDESKNETTFTNVQPGATVSATVTCKVGDVKEDYTTLTNEVKGKFNGKEKSAYAYITVRKYEEIITISKGGYVGNTPGNKEYIIGINEKNDVTYIITVKNDGTKEGEFSFTDDLSTINGFTYGSMTITKDGTSVDSINGLSYANNKVTATDCEIGAGETITVTIKGTLSVAKVEGTDEDYKVTNTLKDPNDKVLSSVEFTGKERQANLGIVKYAVDGNKYVTGESKQFIIEVTNSGDLKAENVTVNEVPASEITINDISWASDNAEHTGLTVTKTEDNKFTINEILPGEKITFTVDTTISDTATGNITNKATLNYNDDTKESSTTITRDTSSDYKVEKWIVDKDGNKLADADGNIIKEGFEGFNVGDTVTYRVKFTNNSATTIRDLMMEDYAVKQVAIVSESIRIIKSDSSKYGEMGLTYDGCTFGREASDDYPSSNDFSTEWGGYRFFTNEEGKEKSDTTSVYPHLRYYFKEINLKKGQSIELEIKFKVAASQQWDTSPYTNKIKFFPENFNEQSVEIKVPINSSFTTAKTVDGDSTIDIQSTLDDFKNKNYTYNIKLTPNSDDKKDYTGSTFTITDELPDGMVFDSIDTANTIGVDGAVKYEQVGNKLTLTFKPTLKGTNLSGVTIAYKTKLTPEKAEQIFNTASAKNPISLTNTVTEIKVDTLNKTYTPNSTATITFTKKAPAPGFAKLAYASFAGQTYDPSLINYVNNGYITAGDTLIWNLVLYNGDGSSKYDTTNTADIDLSKITLTDYLPNGYEYNNDTGYKATARIISIKAEEDETVGDYRQPVYDKDNKVIGQKYKDSIGDSINVPQESIQYDASTRKLKIDLSKISGLSKLAPNQCLVIEFVTTATNDIEGVVTNNGEAKFTNDNITISNENIVAGERKDDKTIFNSANYNIVGLTTESWKTITYTNQGHSGDPHTDPATDTGESRTPTHNYVQGMQGENVTYTLHVKNNSPLSLENFVLIDRLPYVNDIGLVSGYSRNSAFSVNLASNPEFVVEIQKANGTKVILNSNQYDIHYSTDKTAVLNEYSKDWVGKNDKMTWTETPTNAVDFRIRITDGTVVEANDEVVITFKGTVPSFVENTGEKNIAWNSFAYAYQNKEILGSTVMVAEPAKVGVWVEKPQTENKIIINKELKATEGESKTFYFALFGDNTGTKRISDVISLTVPAGSTTASVTMENLDYETIKEANGMTQADNIYLLETNAKGEVISSSNSAYGVDYTGNTIDISKAENTVTVTNTKQTKQITVTKTLTGTTTDTDTFYFAVFTKNGDEFVRYEEAGIKSLTMSKTSENDTKATVTFDVPQTGKYYIFETNENGVLVDTISADDEQTEYTGSQSGEKYKVTGAGLATDNNIEIKNTKVTNYSITVSKSLSSDETNINSTFYVGLYDSKEEGATPIEKKEILAGGEVTFEYLNSEKTYYIFECDKDGTKKTNGQTFAQDALIDNEIIKNREFTVSYDLDSEKNTYTNENLTFDEATSHHDVLITNIDTNSENKITLTKTFDISDTTKRTETFYFGLFTYDKTTKEYSKVDGFDKTITITSEDFENDKAEKSITFGKLSSNEGASSDEKLPSGEYYVFETDDKGNIITENSVLNSYIVNYDGSNCVVLGDGIVEGSVNITNTCEETASITFAKYDVLGNRMKGATFTLTSEKDIPATVKAEKATISGNTITWTTDGTKDVTITGLPKGKYTLTETPMTGFQTINSLTFSIGENGYIETSTDTTEDSYTVSANSVTVVNKSEISVSKKDFAEKGNADAKEIEGALITIARTDGNKLIGNVTLSRTNGSKTTLLTETQLTKEQKKAFEQEDGKFDNDETNPNSNYAKIDTKIGFYSDGQNPTIITGLPDGTYTMTEVVAPTDYGEIKTALTFKIENGKVQRTDSDDTTTNPDYDKYDVSEATTEKGNTITMFDTATEVSTAISIEKREGNENGEILTGALFKITATSSGVDFSGVTLARKNGTDDAEFKKATIKSDKLFLKDETTGTETEITSETPKYTTYYGISTDKKTLLFYSDGTTILNNLADGTYELEELAAPEGYIKGDGIMTITVKDGEITVNADNTSLYGYEESSYTLTVVNTAKSNDIFISKKAVGGTDELAGALITITRTDGDLSNSYTSLMRYQGDNSNYMTHNYNFRGQSEDDIKEDFPYNEDNKDSYVLTTDKKTIGFYSDGNYPTEIMYLPNGTYTLKELLAPDNYETLTTTFEFTLKNGKVTVVANNDTEHYKFADTTITMLNQLAPEKASISIRKESSIVGTGGQREILTGALFRLTANSPDSINLSNVTPARKSGTNAVTFIKATVNEAKDKLLVDNTEITSETENYTNYYGISEDNKSILFYSDNTTAINDLPNGVYILEELVAPEYYDRVDYQIQITIKNGKIVKATDNKGNSVFGEGETGSGSDYVFDNDENSDSGVVLTNNIQVRNTPKNIFISKKAVGGTKELEGALITITRTDEDETPAWRDGVTSLKRNSNDMTGTVLEGNVIDENTSITKGQYVVTANSKTIGFYSDGNYATEIKNLLSGTYELKEVVAPDGYRILTTTFKFAVSDDGKITTVENKDAEHYNLTETTITMSDDIKSTTISKVDEEGNALTGAKFQLIYETTEYDKLRDLKINYTRVTGDSTSDNDYTLEPGTYYCYLYSSTSSTGGNMIEWLTNDEDFVIENLPAGNYTLREVSAPTGYNTASDITFKIDENGYITDSNGDNFTVTNDKITVVNTEIPKVSVSKKAIGGTKELPKALITITAKELLTEKPFGDVTLSRGNTTLTKFVPASSEDKIEEINDKTFAYAGNEQNYIVTDNGLMLGFWSGDAETIITQLPDGTYEMREVIAPDNYNRVETVFQFTISDGVITASSVMSESGEEIQDSSDFSSNPKAITMFDTPKDKTVTIKKTDITSDEEIGGATLELTPKTEQTEDIFKDVTISNNFTPNSTTELSEGEYKKEANKITWVSIGSRDNKALTITGIKEGTYILKETIAPDGYTIATEIEFTVNSDGTITRSEGNELVPVTDRIITVQDNISRIEISKKEINGTSELPGAELKLTKTGNFTDDEISKVEEATDNRKITFKFDGITWTSGEEPIILNQLPDGNYTLTETTAPDNYEKAENINFTIENGKITTKGTDITETSVTMRDEKQSETPPTTVKHTVTISKQDITNNSELPGAKLTITKGSTAGGTIVKQWTSGDTPKKFELEAGTYMLTEVTAPDGYLKAESIIFIINSLGGVRVAGDLMDNGTVVMKDTPMTVYISKQDITGSEELAGAKLEITQIDENGDKVTNGFTTSWTSTDEKTLIERIPAGTYELTEITAPDGYEVAENIVFTVDEEGKITIDGNEVTDKTIVMKDAPTKVYISKQDITGSEELEGAKLEITQIDENGNKVTDGFTKSWTSTKEKTLIEKIPTGTYELTEITAPEGYEVAEKIVFTVDKYGKITIDGKEVTDKTVVMYDKPVETTTTSETTATTTETIVTVTTVPTTETTVTTAPTTTTETTTHTTITIPTTETTTTTVTTSPTTETTTTTPTETTRATTATTVPTTETTTTTAPTITSGTTTTTTTTSPTTETTTTTPTETTKATTTTVPTTETTVTTAPTTTSVTTTSQTTTTTKGTTTSATTETTTETTTTVPTTETTITTAPTTTTETTTHTTVTIPTTETTTTTVTTSPTTVSDTTTSQTTTPTETTITTVTTVPTTETTVTTAPTTTTETTTHTTITVPTTETTTTTVTTSPTTVSDTTTSQTTTPTETTITTVPTTETTVTTVSTTDTEPTTHTTVTVPTTETTTTTETTSPTTVSGTTTSQTTTPTETTITTVPTTETTVTTVSTTDTEPTTHTTVTIPTTETTETTETTSDTEYTMTMPTTSMTEDSTESTVATTDTQVCDTTSEGATTPSDTSFTESVTTTEVTGNTSDTTETTSYTTITTETTIVTTIPSDTETSTTTSPDMTMTTTESSMTNTSDTTETTVSTADSSDTTTVTTIPEDTTTGFTTPSDMTMTTTGTSMTNNSETTETTDETSETTEMSGTTVSTDTTETSRTTRTTTYTTRSTTSTTRTTKSTTSTTKHSTTNSPKTGDNFLASISALITLAGISVVLTGRRKK